MLNYAEGVREGAVTDYIFSHMSVASISKKYNISPRAVYHWIRDYRREHPYTRNQRRLGLSLADARILSDVIANATFADRDTEAVALCIRDRLEDIIQELEAKEE